MTGASIAVAELPRVDVYDGRIRIGALITERGGHYRAEDQLARRLGLFKRTDAARRAVIQAHRDMTRVQARGGLATKPAGSRSS